MTADMKSILIVEDNKTIRLVLKLQLKSLGWSVDEAIDGVEALARFNANEYAAILMDIQLPGPSGLEVAASIRQLELTHGRTRVPIIAITARTEKDECIESGLDDYLCKPMLIEQLREKLQLWIKPNSAP